MPWGAILFGILTAVGAALFTGTARNLNYAFLSRRWPATGGQVVTAPAGGERVRDRRGNYVGRFQPKFVYQYVAGDHAYFGRRVGFSFASFLGCGRYHAGQKVSVSYYPRRPEVAVLRPGVTAFNFLEYAAALAWTLMSFTALCVSSRMF